MSNEDSYSSESSRSSESDWEYVDCATEQSDKSQNHVAQTSDTSDQTNITNNTIIIEKDFEKAILCKEKGNELFREKSYDLCIQEYSQAIALCPIDPIHNEILATFYGNRAAAYYSIYEYIFFIFGISIFYIGNHFIKVVSYFNNIVRWLLNFFGIYYDNVINVWRFVVIIVFYDFRNVITF